MKSSSQARWRKTNYRSVCIERYNEVVASTVCLYIDKSWWYLKTHELAKIACYYERMERVNVMGLAGWSSRPFLLISMLFYFWLNWSCLKTLIRHPTVSVAPVRGVPARLTHAPCTMDYMDMSWVLSNLLAGHLNNEVFNYFFLFFCFFLLCVCFLKQYFF
jgi:hypothetical protein